jgi:hypothetical protein
MLFMATFQYIISFVACELLEHNIIQTYIKRWLETPIVRKINQQINIIEDYQSEGCQNTTVCITTTGTTCDDTVMIESDDDEDDEYVDNNLEDEILSKSTIEITYPHWLSTNLSKKNAEIRVKRPRNKQREEFILIN